MTIRLKALGLPNLPSREANEGSCRILLLALDSAWSRDFKGLAKQLGFRVIRVENAVEALVHINDYDPHILVVNEYPADDLTLVDLCDALRIPRQLRPLAILVTTEVSFPPGEDLGELGIDEIVDTKLPLDRYTSSLMQHYKLQVAQRHVLDREREILDSLPDALIVLDQSLAIWKANRAFALLFGITDPQILRRNLGAPLASALEASMGEKAKANRPDCLTTSIDLAMRNGKESFECRVIINGKERSLAGQITELAGSGGQILVTLRDVTDREQQLMREARRERLATIGNLSVGVAHEIQNPNTFSRVNAANLKALFQALTPFLEELEQQDAARRFGKMTASQMIEKISTAISGVETASQRIASVLETLKGFGQTSGDSLGEVNAAAVIAEAVLLTKHVVRGKANLIVELPDHLPMVRASSSELSQVFINLIENATQAFEFPGQQARGTGEAEIRIQADRITDEELVIAVSDNGPGIDEAVQAQIFRPYFTTRAQGVGTGLGLSLSSDIMHRFGGDLTVRSRRAAGASFLVTLKRADAIATAHT